MCLHSTVYASSWGPLLFLVVLDMKVQDLLNIFWVQINLH